jgi:hemolysin activation/secretion protein
VWGEDFRLDRGGNLPRQVTRIAASWIALWAALCCLGAFSPALAQQGESTAKRPAEQNKSAEQGKDDKQGAGKKDDQSKAGDKPTDPVAATAARLSGPKLFDIDEYRIDGADKLSQVSVEQAVYPFLGPKRTAADVEKARAALEKAYHDRGFQTINVSVPDQNVATGLIVFKAAEAKVGRVRVTNSRFYDTRTIRNRAVSLKEGEMPNFNDLTKDIIALNQWPDRRVTPALRAGVTPGTVDVDLNVEDRFPLHGTVEYNNRYSPNTTQPRLSATAHYDNLWQLGHSASVTYQVAPQRRRDAEVFSGSYLARVSDWTSLLVYGVDSKSDVATIGGMNVVGPGQIIGGRVVITLPARDNFFHSLSFGADYKSFGQVVNLGTDQFSTPITYYPLAVSYGATWQNEGSLTQFNISATANVRGVGSSYEEFDAKRYQAAANFVHLNADLSHTQELPEGFQVFGRVKGQYSDGAMVSSEQFSLGGLDTVRGYLESETIGDIGVAGTVEFRSPDIGGWLQGNLKDETGEGKPRFTTFNEWRLFGFVDAGTVSIFDPLPGQQRQFDMWSYGVGTRFKVFDHLSGMVTFASPLITQAYSRANAQRVLFSIAGEF